MRCKSFQTLEWSGFLILMRQRLSHEEKSTSSLIKDKQIKNWLKKQPNNNTTCLTQGVLGVMSRPFAQQVSLFRLSHEKRSTSSLIKDQRIKNWLKKTIKQQCNLLQVGCTRGDESSPCTTSSLTQTLVSIRFSNDLNITW